MQNERNVGLDYVHGAREVEGRLGTLWEVGEGRWYFQPVHMQLEF